MRRILNLNPFALKFLGMIACLGVAAPAVLYLLSIFLTSFHFDSAWTLAGIRMCIGLSAILLAMFVALIIIEQIQDHLLARIHERNIHQKLQITVDVYECQACGNRQVGLEDRICSICGQEFSF